MAKVIAVYNKKGGCGKTTTATTLAYLLARCGKRTALIDLDSQGDSSLAYGVPNPDKLQTTILSLVKQVIIGEPLPSPSSYMYSYHGVDLVPSNEEISTLERNLSNVDFREYILKEYISQISPSYDYIIIDCMPNFDTSMLNVMVCADSVVIPTQAEYYSAIGSMKFIRNFQQIRQHANPKLEIAGILIIVILLFSMTISAAAAEDMWEAADRIIKDVYTKIAGISTVLAGLMSAVAVVGAKVSNNQHKTDQAWDWLKRIWLCWIVINGIGAFLAYVQPLFDGLATLDPDGGTSTQ